MRKITTRARLAATSCLLAGTALTTEQITAVVDGAALLVQSGDLVSAEVLLSLFCDDDSAHTALTEETNR